MNDKKDSFVIWPFLTLIGLALAPNINAQTTQSPAIQPAAKPAANSLPLTSTVSYDSLRIMAYSGQTDQAIKLAQDYLKNHENSSIRVLLARMLAWNKQFDAAREQLMFVLSKHPGDYDANDCLSDIEMWQGNNKRAIDVLTNAIKYNPDSEGLLEKREIIRAKVQIAEGHRDKAIQMANDYLKAHDSNNMRLFLATQLSVNKQYDQARKLLEEILVKKPASTEASNELANIEISQENYSKALEIINNGLKYSPQNSNLLRNKTYVTEKLNSPKKPVMTPTPDASPNSILSSLTSTINSTTPVVTATNQKASGPGYDEIKKLSDSGQRQKAIKLAQESLKQSDNSDIRILLGLMLSWDGRYDEARTQFQTVLKQKPDSLDATKGLANVEIWSDHKKQALVVINNGLKYHSRDKDLLKQRDTAQGYSNTLSPADLRKIYSSGQIEKAKEIARAYLSKNDNVDIRLVLGLMESWDSEYDDSKVQLKTVLQKSPRYADASLALANVYIYTDDYFSALDIVNIGLQYNPTNADLLKKRADIIQHINQLNIISPGLFSVFNLAGAVGPYSPGAKMNAVIFNQEMTYVDDLKQIWKITSLGYERYTPLGPVIFTFNQTDRFDSAGNQVVIEAYPHLFQGAYMYLGYGYSTTSYLARNYIGFEPFFSLPHGFEFSAGERVLQFRGGTTHLYTGSFAKYIGNYWFSLRPYYTGEGSRSYYFTARRYFSSPDSYISLTVGGGEGSNAFDLQNPDSISSNLTRTIRLAGDVPLTQNFIFTWLAQYSYDHFPNTNIRQQTNVDAGFIWRF